LDFFNSSQGEGLVIK